MPPLPRDYSDQEMDYIVELWIAAKDVHMYMKLQLQPPRGRLQLKLKLEQLVLPLEPPRERGCGQVSERRRSRMGRVP
jgi:hypothetical protein